MNNEERKHVVVSGSGAVRVAEENLKWLEAMEAEEPDDCECPKLQAAILATKNAIAKAKVHA